MEFKKYVETLNKFLEAHPESANLPVIYGRDDEGNGYQEVNNTPTLGVAEDPTEYHIEIEDWYGEGGDIEKKDCNVICIN